MADQTDTEGAEAPATPPIPTLEDMQHWTWVMGRAQQMMMEHLAAQMGEAAERGAGGGEGGAGRSRSGRGCSCSAIRRS